MAKPTEKQIRMMHLVNLISISYVDGNISQDEVAVLKDIAQRMDLTEDDFNECVEYWKSTDEVEIPISIPENEEEEVEFLKDFTLVMMVDGKIEENEKRYLSNMAKQFGYNPDKVVPQLIDIVYNEYCGNNNNPDDEAEEDDLFEDTYDESQINLGKYALQGKRPDEAFDELFLPALRNAEALACFHSIPGIDTRLFRLSPEQVELIQKAADKGYAVAHYTLGRYHQVVRPDEDSLDKAQMYLESAVKAGIPDAQWALAMRYLYGYHGPVTYENFNDLIDKAIDNGSMMALRQRLYDTIHGKHGQKADPKNTIKMIEAFLAQSEDNGIKYAYMYDLLGDAYRKIGNKEKADLNYEKAQDNGYFESGASRFQNKIEGPDKDFYRDTLSMFLDFSCDDKDPNSFLARALERAFKYENEPDDDLTQEIKDDLEAAYNLGNGDAASYLGAYYYFGDYGFEQNTETALGWLQRGQKLESGLAYAGMAEIILNGDMPYEIPDDYLAHCLLNAVRREVEEPVPDVVEAYKAGKLDDFAEEIEKVYIPMLNQKPEEGEIPTIVIVSAKGEAVIYKVEKEEWYKLRHITGARRIFPVRLDALEKLGKKAGLTDHLMAWADIDGPRKDLTSNGIATKFYKGVIAGDVVFSLGDKLYDPMPFYGIDEAKDVIKALGAELKQVVTDISKVSDERNEPIDISKVNPKVNKGYIARIEPDGKAHIINSSLDVFAMFEDDIYDPVRQKNLYDLGKKTGLKERLTLWIDNSALRKQLNWKDEITPNPIGAKWYPGPVAENVFVALEDEGYRMTLFDDLEALKKTCIALGVKPEDIIVE